MISFAMHTRVVKFSFGNFTVRSPWNLGILLIRSIAAEGSVDKTGEIVLLLGCFGNATIAKVEVKMLLGEDNNTPCTDVYGVENANNSFSDIPDCTSVLFARKPGYGIGFEGVISLSKSCVGVSLMYVWRIQPLCGGGGGVIVGTNSQASGGCVAVTKAPVEEKLVQYGDGHIIEVEEAVALNFLKDNVIKRNIMDPTYPLHGITKKLLQMVIDYRTNLVNPSETGVDDVFMKKAEPLTLFNRTQINIVLKALTYLLILNSRNLYGSIMFARYWTLKDLVKGSNATKELNAMINSESTGGLRLDEVQWMFIVYDFLQEYSFDLLVAWFTQINVNKTTAATKLNDLQSCKGLAFWMAPEGLFQTGCCLLCCNGSEGQSRRQ
ncbi:hypothetical protein POM88_001559 [Heracleum sosnowskyi]|uniref:Uncharacterized protein n=1 Tax=Heracleum sosnowskyi TaxID=360622 RepID=A0AAD8JEE5_9APIA|nr:hypothetical protein POM88_001559 [Heracleum sosnowskyi]